MLLIVRPILGKFGFDIVIVIEVASTLASISAANMARLEDVVPILIIIVEALASLPPCGGAAPASRDDGEVALLLLVVVIVEFVDLSGVDVEGDIPDTAKGRGW